MRLRKMIKRVTCCFAVGLSMCIGLLGGVGTTTAYAEETGEVAVGEADAIDEQVAYDSESNVDETSTTNEFVDEANMVDASYTAVTATYDFDTAYEILNILNQERNAAGLPSLTMDKDLMEAAMFRGVETSESFSHTRPNGQRCFTICSKAYGENIAYGHRNASHVMEAWMNSEGHRNNILGERYTTVGIGAVVIDGTKYYVQLFGLRNLTEVSSKPANQTVAVNVPMSSDATTVFPSISYGSNKVVFPEYTDTETIFPDTDVTVSYRTHIQSFGWSGTAGDVSDWQSNGEISGTIDLDRRMESVEIKVSGNADLGVTYRTHVQTYGWSLGWSSDGQLSGTTGQSKRVEAIQIKLTGADASKYDIYYRVNTEDYGWLGWAKNGQLAGTSGQSKRLEAIQIIVVPAGEKPSGLVGYSYIEYAKVANNTSSNGMINYMTHVQTYGDQSYVYDGSIAGTFLESKRLEAIRINLNNDLIGMDGGVRYTTHVQTFGWQGNPEDSSTWVKDGEKAGTSGYSKRLEAICIELYGDVADNYDVYYRVHAQTFGWLDWAKNGEPAGTAGYSKRLEAIQIVLVPKDVENPFGTGGQCFVNAY